MDNRIIALSIYNDANLNNPKLTRSVGRNTLAIASRNNPAESTARTRTNPHCTPMNIPAAPMHMAAIMLEIAIAERVTWNPYVEGKVGSLAAW